MGTDALREQEVSAHESSDGIGLYMYMYAYMHS